MASDVTQPPEVHEIDQLQEPPILEEPESNEARRYIQIRPAETPLDFAAVEQLVDLIESTLRAETKTGLWHALGGSTAKLLIEVLFVSSGGSDPSLRYLIGSNDDEITADLEGLLRTGFPNTYEFETVWWHPRRLVEHLSSLQNRDAKQPLTPKEEHPEETIEPPYIAGVELVASGVRRRDWQTPLASFDVLTSPVRQARPSHENDARRIPLNAAIEVLCSSSEAIVLQFVLSTFRDWTNAADYYVLDLESGEISTFMKIYRSLFPPDPDRVRAYVPPHEDRERLDGIRSRDPRRTLCVSARAAVITFTDPANADRLAHRLSNAFGHLSGRYHRLRGRVATDTDLHSGVHLPPGSAIFEEICEQICHAARYKRLGDSFRFKKRESKGIVVTPRELPGLCLLDGSGLTPTGRRAIATRPAERTGMTLPPPAELAAYRAPGMALGRPLTHDRLPHDEEFYLPARLQDRHILVVGDTGAGKTIAMLTAMLTNLEARTGPSVYFDHKGGGSAKNYLRAHYASHGTLEDVVYFDLARYLPAISFFDIRPLLAAGIPREEARSRKAAHYEEVLIGLMGAERYAKAVESPKIIRNHLRAVYDPVHGTDVLSHTDFYDALRRTLDQREPPPVSNDEFAKYFTGLLARDRDVFNKVLGGAVTRVDTIASDDRLRTLFNHTPDKGGPHFDFTDFLDHHKTVIFDFGGMDEEAKRSITLALLSTLWAALRARTESARSAAKRSPINLYLDDARGVADTKLVDTLLSQGRSFGVSLMLGVQFPEQLDSPDPENNTYREALNETGTFLAGKVSVDSDLAKVLATDDMPPAAVERRLATMRRGEWLLRPGADFGQPTPRPFLVESLPAPMGHPASEERLSDEEEAAFLDAFERLQENTRTEHGLTYEEPTRKPSQTDRGDAASGSDDALRRDTSLRVDSLLPYTERLPACVRYDHDRHALLCETCDNRYNPTIEGMVRAIECCHSLDNVDRDDIPACESHLKLSADERAASGLSDRQLLFLQAVYNAQQRRYDSLEYDMTSDSMLRLHEYVGIDAGELVDLVDADLLRHDTDRPHKLYSVSPEGRSVIGEAYRQGVDYGHGKGDLEESSEHVFGMIIGERFAQQTFIDDPDHPGQILSPYHDIDDQHRLDIAVLDRDGDVVVAIEVERINHDYLDAIPQDFDKMASCNPEEAIWIVNGREAGRTVVDILYDPPDGQPRVEKTYSENTPLHQYSFETPGLTSIYTAEYLRDAILKET